MRYIIIAAAWLWGLAALPEVTNAMMSFNWFLGLVPAGVLIEFAWLIYSRVEPGIFRLPYLRLLWLTVPAIAIGMLILGFTHHGFALRVRLYDSELRNYAESVRQNPDPRPREGQRVGSFDVKSVEVDENQVLFHTASGVLRSGGLVYRPDGTPPEYPHSRGVFNFEYLFGPWWWFSLMKD